MILLLIVDDLGGVVTAFNLEDDDGLTTEDDCVLPSLSSCDVV